MIRLTPLQLARLVEIIRAIEAIESASRNSDEADVRFGTSIEVTVDAEPAGHLVDDDGAWSYVQQYEE